MLNIDFKKPRKQIKHGVLTNKQKNKDEVFLEKDKKMTYAEKRKRKNFGSQEKPSPYTLHASAADASPYPSFQAPSIRVIDLRNLLAISPRYVQIDVLSIVEGRPHENAHEI